MKTNRSEVKTNMRLRVLIEHLCGNHRVCQTMDSDCDVCPTCGRRPPSDESPLRNAVRVVISNLRSPLGVDAIIGSSLADKLEHALAARAVKP